MSKPVKAAIWQRNNNGDKKSPVFKGNIEFDDGKKMKLTFWSNKGKAPNAPTFTGVIEDE